MSNIFIQNPTIGNVAVRITGGEGTEITNLGPEGAMVTEDNRTSICLAPEVPLPKPVVNTTQPIGLDGKYVVKINGEFVPYIFNAVDLQNYFDQDDTSGTGVVFEEIK